MVPLDPLGVRTLWGNAVMRREAAEDLLRLTQAARAAGEDLVVASGYRSFEDQRAVHAELTGLYGEEARRLSAPPGHSEHQLGTTVDFTNREARYAVGPAFEGTGAHGWLREHAHEYGFVQSYERGKEGETGYRAEAWHYRHIGAEDARRLEGTDLSLRAFLLREGVTPRCS
jgi:LAS superfamily LD-carboxypeptidase LdcB